MSSWQAPLTAQPERRDGVVAPTGDRRVAKAIDERVQGLPERYCRDTTPSDAVYEVVDWASPRIVKTFSMMDCVDDWCRKRPRLWSVTCPRTSTLRISHFPDPQQRRYAPPTSSEGHQEPPGSHA